MKSMSVGTVLKVNNKTIGGLKSISGVEISADTSDVTCLSSEDGYKEFLAGFKDGGDVACSGFMDGADEGQSEVYDLVQSGEVVACNIVFPAKIGKTWTFNAMVTKFSTGAQLEDAISFDVTLKVSGKPTLGASAAG